MARNSMGFTFNPANGKFYYGSGYNVAVFSEIYEYDPVADTWTQKASMPNASLALQFAAATAWSPARQRSSTSPSTALPAAHPR